MRKRKKRSKEGFSRTRAEKDFAYLHDRALVFLDLAQRLFKEGKFDIAAFNVEQFCQLHLKFKIGSLISDFARTHSLGKLLEQYGEAAERQATVTAFIKKNGEVLDDLEEAYISSRYIPSRYSKTQVARMLEFVERLRIFLS